MNQSNKTSPRAQIAGNLPEETKDPEPARELLEPSAASIFKANPIQIFKASTENPNFKNAMVSTRYQEQEECSVLENSEIKLKKTQTSDEEVVQAARQEPKKETTRRPKATRNTQDNARMFQKEQRKERKRSSSGKASRSPTRSEHRVKQDLLSDVKRLLESKNQRADVPCQQIYITSCSGRRNDSNETGNKTKREITPRIDTSDFDGNGTKVDFDLT